MKFRYVSLPAAVLLGLAGTGTNAGWVNPFTGWVEMSDCPACDSTVSFAVWENTDGDWFGDLGLASADRQDFPGVYPDGTLGSVTGAEKYVYLYQVVNTNHASSLEDAIEAFRVADLQDKYDNDLFTGGGYWDGWVFDDTVQYAGGPVLGTTANVNYGPTPGSYVDDPEPDDTFQLPLNAPPSDRDPETGDAGGNQSGDKGLANPSFAKPTTSAINAPDFLELSKAATGVNLVDAMAQFDWVVTEGLLLTTETSPVLFLVSNARPTFYWGNTESDTGAGGASGDVPVPTPIPGTVLLLGAGLAGLGAARARARR
jgi:hypothetical protein